MNCCVIAMLVYLHLYLICTMCKTSRCSYETQEFLLMNTRPLLPLNTYVLISSVVEFFHLFLNTISDNI